MPKCISKSDHEMSLGLKHEVVRKIELARSFLDLAQDAARTPQDLGLFIAINQLQDAVEIFLFAVAEHLGVSLKEKGGFDGYIETIDKETGTHLPYRQRLNALNKSRVSSKHYAIQPDRREVDGFIRVATDFFIEVSRTHFKAEFASISLVHLLSNKRIKEALSSALTALSEKRFADALIESRKGFYTEFEQHYDISPFKDPNLPKRTFKHMCCRSPSYAKSADYIARTVSEPTAYIVFDHARIDSDLSKGGISHTTFWNIWRLTPALYYVQENDEWFVKHEYRVLEDQGIQERADYAVHKTIELCLAAQRVREATKSGAYGAWTVKFRPDEVRIYSKADLSSDWKLLPPGIETALSSYWTKGLDGNLFWHVSSLDHGIFGFVIQDDLAFD